MPRRWQTYLPRAALGAPTELDAVLDKCVLEEWCFATAHGLVSPYYYPKQLLRRLFNPDPALLP